MTKLQYPLCGPQVCLQRAACLTCLLYKKFSVGPMTVAYPGIFFLGGGVQQIQLRTEGKENGDLGSVGVSLNLWMNKTHILIRLLETYIPRNWEFGPAFSKLRNFRGDLKPPNPPGYTSDQWETSVPPTACPVSTITRHLLTSHLVSGSHLA
jgi:hypothetical protein